MSVPTLLHQAWAAQTRRNGLAWKTDRGQRAGQRCIGVPWELVRTVCVRGRSYRQWVSRHKDILALPPWTSGRMGAKKRSQHHGIVLQLAKEKARRAKVVVAAS